MTVPRKPFLKISGEAAVWLGIAAVAWVLTYQFADRDMLFRWGADLWPRAVIIAIVVGAVVQFLVQFRALASAAGSAQAEIDEEADEGLRPARAIVTTVATLVVPLVYLYLLPRAGYYLTTPFFICAVMFIFGVRKARHLVGTAAAIYLILLLIFTKVLFVPMPAGYWPGFYDFSNWLLDLIG